jgi:predicted short-subunit dehydrogenase-like oxidoreductase (DUF2520 family)
VTSKPKLGFVGNGRVGKGLSLALSRAGYEITGVAGRGQEQHIVDASEIVFLTVPDDALFSVCEKLTWEESKSAIHCSGAAELSVLKHAEEQGAQTGGFHPLQMFADPEVAARGIKGCAIAVEAEEPLAGTLLHMVADLEARPLRLPPGSRAAYHAGAHYAAAFVAGLLAEGIAIWGRLGIREDDALAALIPLLRGATDAIAHSGPARAMAGSVARGDFETVKRHLEALNELDPKMRELYRTLALRTLPLAVTAGKIDPARAARVRELLERET